MLLLLFFDLERKKGQEKLMYCLKDCNGGDTSDQTEMRINCGGFLFKSIRFCKTGLPM